MGIFCFIEGFLSDHSCNNIKELIATLVNMKIIFTFLFFPYIALLIAKVSLMATFCHEKEMKDTIKKHASHIRFSNEVLMKYKPLKLFINFALVTESIQTSKKNLLLLLQMIHDFRSEGSFVFWSYICSQILCFLYWHPKIGL